MLDTANMWQPGRSRLFLQGYVSTSDNQARDANDGWEVGWLRSIDEAS